MENNLTSGSVFKNVAVFSLPYLLSYFLQTLYGMADLFIIGQYAGVEGTTAVAIGSQVMHMFTVMIIGLAMGSTVSIGKAVGARNRRKASLCIGNTATLFVGLSVLITAVLLLLTDSVVSLMSTPAPAVKGTAAYLTVCFAGIPFITAYNIISSIFRGMGDSKSPMYFVVVACAANIGLDYLFIGALGMGPAGAALGTTLSQAVSVAAALYVICRQKSIALTWQDLKPSRGTIAQLLSIGVPIALQDGLIQVAFLLITVIANKCGIVDSAAVGIVEKFISFIFLVPSSMLSTVSALGAQNIGAGKPERAVQTLLCSLVIAVSFGIIVSIIMQFAAEPTVALFTDNSAVIAAGGQYLRGYILDCLFAGIHFSFSGYFCACGKSGISFLHNITALVLVRLPGAYITSMLFPSTLLPMGLATAAGSLLSAIICVAAFAVMSRRAPAVH